MALSKAEIYQRHKDRYHNDPEYRAKILQQKADYKMNLELDDKNKKLYGSETITYYNNAPEALEYLWVQLEQNIERPDSKTPLVESQNMDKAITVSNFTKKYMDKPFEGGFNIEYVS